MTGWTKLVVGGETYVELRLPPMCRVEYEIVDAADGARHRDEVYVDWLRLENEHHARHDIRGGSGRDLIPAGEYIFLVTGDGIEPLARRLHLSGGPVPTKVRFEVRPRSARPTVRRFVDRAGRPLAGCWIEFEEVEIAGLPLPRELWPSVILDDKGEGDLEWLPPGVYPVVVSRPGRPPIGPPTEPLVADTAGQGDIVIDFDLEEWAGLDGGR